MAEGNAEDSGLPDDPECGGCFSEMIPLRITATHVGGSEQGPIVGKQCPNCGRTYLEDLIPQVSLRLDRARDNRMEADES